MWFRGSDSNLLVKVEVKCGQMPKFRNYRIFLSFLGVLTVFYLSVQFDHAKCGRLQIFASILRSSFFRGDLCVFDFFGNTHRDAQ